MNSNGFIWHKGKDGNGIIDGLDTASGMAEALEHRTYIEIPETLDNGCTVTGIADFAFECNDDLKQVVLPRTLKWIGECAFWACRSLTAVLFQDGLQDMGAGSFYFCPLTELYLSSQLKNSIWDLFIGDKYVPMEYHDDSDEFMIFTREGLKEIRVSEENPRFSVEDGVLFDKSKETLLCYPPEKDGASYTVPFGTRTIGWDSFFKSKKLRQVFLPDTVENIENYAFSGSGIQKLRIPDGVKSVHRSAFRQCGELTEVYMPPQCRLL